MAPRADKDTSLNAVLIAFFVAVFVLASPFHLLWTSTTTPWYVPYLVWLGIIAAAFGVQRWRTRHDL
jgi:H+/Cl- antiporter ClcA